jgi:hypothetical protein
VTIGSFTATQQDTPSATIDYISEYLTGLAAGTYSFNGDTDVVISGTTHAIYDGWFGTTVQIVRKGDGLYTTDSVAQGLSIPTRPDTPTPGYTSCTNTNNNNGTITGVNNTMEYSLNLAAWTPITGSTVTSLVPGSYRVRVAATSGTFRSLYATVTIGSFTPLPDKIITGHTALTAVTLSSNEHILTLADLIASDKLPTTAQVTDGTVSATADITDWTGIFNGTTTGLVTLTAVWDAPDGYTKGTTPITITITVNVEVAQTSPGVVTPEIGLTNDREIRYDTNVGRHLTARTGRTLADIQAALDIPAGHTVTITNVSGVTYADDPTANFGTGTVIRLYDGGTLVDTVTVIVIGDTSGDGNVNLTDAWRVIDHIIGTVTLDPVFLLAARTRTPADPLTTTDFWRIVDHTISPYLHDDNDLLAD